MAFPTYTVIAFFFLVLLLHLFGGKSKGDQNFVDSDYVELALNLEYLETEFFLFGALGYGLDKVDRDLSQGGPPPIGGRKANLNPYIKDIIEQFGLQEVGHLRAIKDKVKGFPRPLLNISKELFTATMDKAFGYTLDPPFDPYSDDINYLLASYLIPYVGLTGYAGAAPKLQDPTYKKLVAGLLAVESGQDAVIRSLLYQFADSEVEYYQSTVANFTATISALRNTLGNEGLKDEGLVVDPSLGAEKEIAGNVLAGDAQSLSYERTPKEILRIVYGTGSEHKFGGFFPKGAKGNIAKSFL